MDKSAKPVDVVLEFWRLMGTNDFALVTSVLGPEFVMEWPLSNERIRGGERFAQMNQEYPAHGPWLFTLHRVVAGDGEVVTDVTVTDGVQSARVLSFFTVEEGAITKLVEFWPAPAPPAANRAHLVEPIQPG